MFRDSARDVSAEPWVRLELETPETPVYAGAPFRLGLSFGFDERFVEERMIQLFRQELDLPAQLEVSWLAGLPGTRPLDTRESDADAGTATGLSFALGEEILRGAPLSDGLQLARSFLSIADERSFVADLPGSIEVPPALLRFAYAEGFEEDFLGERRPVGRVDAFVRGPARTLQVLPLPEAGRPPEFAGAIGRFQLAASLLDDGSRLEPGSALRLRLEIRVEPGSRVQSNLEALEAPRLGPLRGLAERGVRELEVPGQAGLRAFVYELEATRVGATDVPPVELWSFDPGPPARYAVARSSPIPLVVHAGARPEAALGAGGPARRDAPSPPSLLLRALGLLGVGALVVGLLAWLATRASRAPRDGQNQ